MVSFLILQFLDLATTAAIYWLAGCDPDIELNPFAHHILQYYGIVWLSVFKVFMVLVVCWLFGRIPEPRKSTLMIMSNGFLLAVVVNNAMLIWKFF